MQKSNNINTTTATCPACGMLCDDINVSDPSANTCAKSISFFSQPITESSPTIAGKPVSLDEAVAKAASILKDAQHPIFAGLSTDLSGFRAAFNSAQQVNAPMMHINAESTWRNTKVLQSKGWQTTTLMEVKNRADVILCIGTDVVSHNPRFFERNVWNKEALFTNPQTRNIIYLGGEGLDTSHGVSPNGKQPTVLPCATKALPEITAALRALIQGKTLNTDSITGIAVKDLETVVTQLKEASYAVLIWVAKDFSFAHAELTIENITESVVTLNKESRAMALALGGSDGDTTVNYAHTWLSALAPEEHDLKQYDTVVWINSFSPEKPLPTTDAPIIAIGNSQTQFVTPPAVFIPVATPALDCAGTLFRVDSSIVLPLKQTRESALPTLSTVMNKMDALLT
ncbi:MAG: formylmethanofuran dehydrogenase [Methylophilaceae bacterium]|nr:formylmethanofuran dehydrogenase [Methylophilaceae bacterium]|tara:strand:- start:9500 stop:10699 length:1200 start_codon:yes stop_codon:yes gene_type:complete